MMHNTHAQHRGRKPRDAEFGSHTHVDLLVVREDGMIWLPAPFVRRGNYYFMGGAKKSPKHELFLGEKADA